MIAEDNVVNQRLALRLLEKLGYRADVVANGLEAVEAVGRQEYDLVLMDVQMPEMDGVQATARSRERSASGDRPWIIAMTAEVMRGDREGFLAAGMNDYVAKPIRPRADRHDHGARRAGAGIDVAAARRSGTPSTTRSSSGSPRAWAATTRSLPS